MAKKVKTTTVEEEVVEAPEEYKDIHDKPMREVIKEASEPEKEEVKEEPKPTPEPSKEEDHGVDFDPEKFKEEVTAEATKKLIEKITGEKEKKKETDEELVSPWAKEGRNPKDYDEIAEWAVQKKDILDTRREKANQEAQVKAQEEKQARDKADADRLNAYIDSEINELYEEGKLPRIKNPEDPSDSGLKSRQALFQKMMEVNQERIKQGLPLEYSPYKIFHKYYKSPTRQPAGADAPISKGNDGGVSQQDSAYTYADIKKPWWQLLRGK